MTLALSACGGGGGGGGAPSTKAPEPRPVLVEEYGDSTTVGVEIFPTGGIVTKNSEPVQLQALLQGRFGSNVTVSNQGVSGIEATQLLDGTDGQHAPWSQQMAASKAQIVTINLGLNDTYYIVNSKPGVKPETPQDYAQAITQLVQIARASGKTVVLYEPNPVCEPIRKQSLGSYVAALRQVAQTEGVQIVAQYDYIQTIPNWQTMLSDCLHPTDALYQIKAQREYAVLEPIVNALQ